MGARTISRTIAELNLAVGQCTLPLLSHTPALSFAPSLLPLSYSLLSSYFVFLFNLALAHLDR
jgi:hypothetical protein